VEFYEPDFFSSPGAATGILEVTPDHQYIRQIRDVCDQCNVRVVAISAQNDLTHPDEAYRRTDLRRLERWFGVANSLGTKIIRVNSGGWFRNSDGISRLVEALREVAPKAKAEGITIAIENHPTNLEAVSDAERLVNIVREFADFGVGLCPDNGHINDNVRFQCLQILLQEAVHCHVKFYEFDRSGEETTIDYRRFCDIAASCGYRGALSMELIPEIETYDSYTWLELTQSVLERLRQCHVPDDIIKKMTRLKSSTFRTCEELRKELSLCFSQNEEAEYWNVLVSHLEKVDPDFGRRKEIAKKAVKLLEQYGVSDERPAV